MENKFINIIPPAQTAILILLDSSAIGLTGFCCYRLLHILDFYGIAGIVISLILLVIGALTTKTLFQTGIYFKENEIEFTGLDEHNCFAYSDIQKFSLHKDTEASLKKNIIERYTSLILFLKDGTVVTLELGYTTQRKSMQIQTEITARLEAIS